MKFKNNFDKTHAESSAPYSVTPQQQLWNLTNEPHHEIFRDVFRRIKKRDQEELCYAMIAYIRFKIRRPFESPFMEVLLQSFIDFLEGDIELYVSLKKTIKHENKKSKTHSV